MRVRGAEDVPSDHMSVIPCNGSLGHRCGGRRPAAGRRYERLRVAALYSGSPDDAAAVGGFPLKRFAAAAEIAAAVAFMASPLVNSITAATLQIDGGLTPTV
jgi:NAD(P)-dependent dehydrogenase (short-subunit alcohol dehydrogenase family)